MLIDQFFHARHTIDCEYRHDWCATASYGSAARDSLADFEPKVDPMLKAQAELLVEHLTTSLTHVSVWTSRQTRRQMQRSDESDDIEAAKA